MLIRKADPNLERIRAQMRVHDVLGGLLAHQYSDDALVPHVMQWTIMGGTLHGQPEAGGDAEREAAIVAWAALLELPVEKTTLPGHPARLSVKGPYTPVGGDPIKVGLAATLNGTDGEDTGPIA